MLPDQVQSLVDGRNRWCDNGGLKSWIGDTSATAEWLVAKWGDVYLHETVISHIRRLMETKFYCKRLGETPQQFDARCNLIATHMNSSDFSPKGEGGGLAALAKDFRKRCDMVVSLRGERLPK